MKIISSLLIAAVALPLGLSMTTAYVSEIKLAIPLDNQAAITEMVSTNLTSEPAIMIVVGAGLIMIAGFGRRRLIKKDNDALQNNDFRSSLPPHPDPVPWKKE